MTTRKTRALIMAAGKGTRMKADIPKVMMKIEQKTMIRMVTDALTIDQIEKIGIIVSPENREIIASEIGSDAEYVIQYQPKGTGYAVISAENWLQGFDGNVVVVVGDAPFISREIITELINTHNDHENTCTLLSAVYPGKPPVYGRIVRAANGELIKIVEERDASEEEKRIKEVGTSHYCFDARKLFQALKRLNSHNDQREYYLTDVVEIFFKDAEKVEAIPVQNPIYTYGLNTQEEFKHGLKEIKKLKG